MPDVTTCHKITELAAAGHSTRWIGDQVGLAHSTVARTKNKPEIAAQIEELQKRAAAELFEEGFQNIKHAITAYRKPETKIDFQLREHGFKLSSRIAEAVGILPAASQSQMVVNVFNQSNTIISPLVDEIIRQHAGTSHQTIDVTPEEVIGDDET